MNLLLVSLKDEFQHVLGYHLKPLGFQVTHLTDPVQAIQKFDDLQPEVILFHAGDFPRHWKPLLRLVRDKRSKEETVFVLLIGEDFELEEAAKAAHLGVNGILHADLADKQEIYRLEELFRRYRTVRDKRNFNRLIPSETDVVGLAFTHPRRLTLVLGTLREISIQGASFLPNPACMITDLEVGQEISRASLLLGEEVVSLNCRVTRNRPELGFQFLSFEEGGHHKLLHYIQGRSQRALQGAVTPGEAEMPETADVEEPPVAEGRPEPTMESSADLAPSAATPEAPVDASVPAQPMGLLGKSEAAMIGKDSQPQAPQEPSDPEPLEAMEQVEDPQPERLEVLLDAEPMEALEAAETKETQPAES